MDKAGAGPVRERRRGRVGSSWAERWASARHALADPRNLPRSVVRFPLLFVAAMVLGKLVAPRVYSFLVREDKPVEYATCLVYLAACGFAAALALDLRRQGRRTYAALYGLLTAGMFFIAMEEISWAQRLVGFETPAPLAALNLQGELTFHNVSWFPLHNAYVLVGFYGAFAWLLVPDALKRRQPMLVDLVVPPRALALYFFFPFALYAYYQYLYYTHLLPNGLTWRDYFTPDRFVRGSDQEAIELLLSLGFLLFVMMNRYRHGSAAPRPATAT